MNFSYAGERGHIIYVHLSWLSIALDVLLLAAVAALITLFIVKSKRR